jgi:CelD/BcsL family acetyltransferase involved in cellulose biosynthesis
MQSTFRVERVTTVPAWHALAADWDRVLRETPGYTPLQSFAFLGTWWAEMGGERRLWILAFYRRNQVAGFAPLQMVTERWLQKSYRSLQFLGMTEDILRPTMLFPASHADGLRETFVDYMARHRDEGDLIELDELDRDDPVRESLSALAGRTGRLYRNRPFHDCPYLDLSRQAAADYWSRRSRRLLKNVRNGTNRLRRLGELTVQVYTTPESLEQGFDALARVTTASWKHAEQLGMSSDARYRDFYRSLLRRFSASGNVRLMTLELDGEPIAATVGISLDRTFCALLIVHDQRYDTYSAGTLLEHAEMTALLESAEFDRYEFMGGALRNKLRWTSDVVATVCVVVSTQDWRRRLQYAFEYRLKPLIKRVLKRLGLFKPQPTTKQALIDFRSET